MKKLQHRACAIVGLLSCMMTVIAAQGSEVDWSRVSVALTEQDKHDILSLAAQLGIRNPQRVGSNGSPCPTLFVVSQPAVNGNRFTTTTLRVWSGTDPDCRVGPPGPETFRQGSWTTEPSRSRDGLAFGNPSQATGWRVRDGDWHVDFSAGPDVTYQDAAAIVTAIHRGTFIDLRDAAQIKVQGPLKVNTDRISSVTRRTDPALERHFLDIYTGQYQVMTTTHDDYTGRGGGGHVLYVKINDGRVELHGWSQWVS